jgi:hypothetical protein
VAGEETHQPRREGDLTTAEQRHIAHTAKGKRPLRRAIAARHQHWHQQRLGQPALPIVTRRREQRVSGRKGHENDSCTTGHTSLTAPPAYAPRHQPSLYHAFGSTSTDPQFWPPTIRVTPGCLPAPMDRYDRR